MLGHFRDFSLPASAVETVVFDYEAAMIDRLGRFGVKRYCGDATRPDLRNAADIESAKAIAIAIDGKEHTLDVVTLVSGLCPQVKIPAYRSAWAGL